MADSNGNGTKMMNRKFLLIGAVSGFLAVALGAFGAHGLKSHVSAEMLAVWQTGVQYQMFHTLALLAVSLLGGRVADRWLNLSGWMMVLGIVLFSGSLYLMTLSGVRWLGVITPFGGLSFLAAWFCLFMAGWRNGRISS